MAQTEGYATWAEIDLGAIRANVRVLARGEAVVMAVVKANGYGHGAVAVARVALEAGARWLGVARWDEALELRRAGLPAPILILGDVPQAILPEAVAAEVSLTVSSAEGVRAAQRAGRQAGRDARLHLKIDTGMHRLGVRPEEAVSLAERVETEPGARLEGVFSHLACADEADPGPSLKQQAAFDDVLQALSARGLRPAYVHLANSAATLRWPGMHYDLVRPGLAVYGLQPSSSLPLGRDLTPALAWKARLSQVKRVAAGQGIGYGHTYRTRDEELIGTVTVGYGDGFRRWPMNQVLLGGRRCPVVGRVSMDQITIRLDPGQAAEPGDEVVLIGRQGEERLSAEALGLTWGTINYEVTCGIGPRVPRLHLE